MSAVAIGWQVYSVSGKPLDLGLVGLCEFAPLLLLALPAGHLADRIPRRSMLVVALGLDAAVAAGLLAFTASGPTSVWPFFALALGTGVASSLSAPAGRALTPSLVPVEVLPRALAVRSVAFEISAISGPALGGLLFAVKPESVYAVATGLAAVAIGAVIVMRAGRQPASSEAPGLQSVFAGVRLIRRTPVMLGAISLDLFAVLFGGAVALLPVFAKDVLHVGPAGLGVLRSAPAAGALVAAVLLARRPIGRFAGRKLLGVVTAFGVCMVVFGLSRWMWLSFARTRGERRSRSRQRRAAADDPAARHAGCSPWPGHGSGERLHQRVEPARRFRIGGGRRSRGGRSGRHRGRHRHDRHRRRLDAPVPAARAGRPARRAAAWMIDATISRARLRDLARLGRCRRLEPGGAGPQPAAASSRQRVTHAPASATPCRNDPERPARAPKQTIPWHQSSSVAPSSAAFPPPRL